MKEFKDKLISRLEEYKYSHLVAHDSERLEHCKEKEKYCEGSDCFLCVWDKSIEIVNQLAEEYNNDFCEWKQEDEEGFSNCRFTYQEIMNDEVEGFKFCPYCGKRIKIAPYQPKGE